MNIDTSFFFKRGGGQGGWARRNSKEPEVGVLLLKIAFGFDFPKTKSIILAGRWLTCTVGIQ